MVKLHDDLRLLNFQFKMSKLAKQTNLLKDAPFRWKLPLEDAAAVFIKELERNPLNQNREEYLVESVLYAFSNSGEVGYEDAWMDLSQAVIREFEAREMEQENQIKDLIEAVKEISKKENVESRVFVDLAQKITDAESQRKLAAYQIVSAREMMKPNWLRNMLREKA